MERFSMVLSILSVSAHRFRFLRNGWAKGALRKILLKILLFLSYSLLLLLLQPK